MNATVMEVQRIQQISLFSIGHDVMMLLHSRKPDSARFLEEVHKISAIF